MTNGFVIDNESQTIRVGSGGIKLDPGSTDVVTVNTGVVLPNGSVSQPALRFANDGAAQDTGLFKTADEHVTVAGQGQIVADFRGAAVSSSNYLVVENADSGNPVVVKADGVDGAGGAFDLQGSVMVNGDTIKPVATSGLYSDLSGAPTLATVATSGAYADLSGKPTLATVATSGAYADLTGRPTLATVATTGDYSDLTGKPTIPTTLAALTGDVAISSPSNSQVLQYNSISGKWVNATSSGSSPLTTKGDVYTYSTVPTRLGVGANNTVLTADSTQATGLKWGTVFDSTANPIKIGASASTTYSNNVALGISCNANSLFGSVCGGKSSTAAGQTSVSWGWGCSADANLSVSVGYQTDGGRGGQTSNASFGINTSLGTSVSYAVALGINATIASNVNHSCALGEYGYASNWGQLGLAFGRFSANGDAQQSTHILRGSTTDGTQTEIFCAGNSNSRLTLLNNSAMDFDIRLVAHRTDTQGDNAVWWIRGLVSRGANAAATALIGSTDTYYSNLSAGASTWTVSVTADTTNGSLDIKVTGEASKTIRWVAVVTSTQVSQ